MTQQTRDRGARQASFYVRARRRVRHRAGTWAVNALTLVGVVAFVIARRRRAWEVRSKDKTVERGNQARAFDTDDETNRDGAPTIETATRASANRPTRALFETSLRQNREDIFFNAFFQKSFSDVATYGGTNVSKSTLEKLAARSGSKLSLYKLSKNSNSDARFSWTHVAGTSTFWSTNDFHAYVRARVDVIGELLPHDFVEAYFLINNYDEPQLAGPECSDIDRLRRLHANVSPGLVSPHDNAPVWSMSKVRGCHSDILFPFPDYFSHLRANYSSAENACANVWVNRSDDIVFRGSTTGFGNATTNLRARTLASLTNESGFDVGFTEAIQGFQKSWAPRLFKEKMSGNDFCRFKHLLDIDGNAHSFNRQMLVAQAGASLVRVNVFTDWMADGVLNEEFCHAVDPGDVLRSARRVRDALRMDPERTKDTARAYERLARRLTRDDVITWYLQRAFSRYVDAVRFIE